MMSQASTNPAVEVEDLQSARAEGRILLRVVHLISDNVVPACSEFQLQYSRLLEDVVRMNIFIRIFYKM